MTLLIDAQIAEMELLEMDYQELLQAIADDKLSPMNARRMSVRIGLIERDLEFLTQAIIHELQSLPMHLFTCNSAENEQESN